MFIVLGINNANDYIEAWQLTYNAPIKKLNSLAPEE
jgi:hypothetical protein